MIVDTFLYAGLGAEPELVELRLHELDGVADCHVVVEGLQDFQGRPKPARFPELLRRLRGWEARIHYVPLDLPDSNVYPRAPGGRERFARDALGKYLPSGSVRDAIVISDCDEIPRAEVLQRVATAGWTTYVQLGMIPFYMAMNLRVVSDVSQAPNDRKTWPGPVVVRRRVLENSSAYELRDVPGRALVPNGGWHFSFCARSSAECVEKLRSWGHPEFADGRYDTVDNFDAARSSGADWDHTRQGGPLQLRRVEVDESYPLFVRTHPGLFEPFMSEGEP